MSKKRKRFKLHDVIRFGQYKNRPLWEILRDDPGWIAWYIDIMDGEFRIGARARQILTHQLEREARATTTDEKT